ncbi:Prenyltransferase/squalene oxidase [Planctomycetales bacterium 10988]|nr:Prenyltransferase/squalene oxidase [Planctomycetales bacterium 10988]
MSHVSPRRQFLQSMLGSTLAGVAATSSLLGKQVDNSARRLITPAAQQAIDKGLKFLASRQHADGSFGTGGYSRNVGVCGLAGLAFMAEGSTPNRGQYGANIARCIQYLIDHTREDGFIVEPSASSHGPMYGHGFATLYLAECYGMSLREDLREILAKAIQLIIRAQNEDGGWRYHPQPSDADVSVTICQVMALRAARNAGIYVPKATIDRCTEYVKQCQNTDGGFRYMIEGGPSAFPRSAAGVVALYMAGVYEGPAIDRGLDYLIQYKPDRFGVQSRDSHYLYGHYYAIQAMWYAGEEYWEQWYPAIRDDLISDQRSDGSWVNQRCFEYGSAMACIILQLPNNFLPIVQR